MTKILFFSVLCLFAYPLSGQSRPQQDARPKLAASFDCTKEYPDHIYFSHGDVRLVSSPSGQYREAGAVPLSRFGYRFSVKDTGKPYLAVVRYPDDKRRFMCMMEAPLTTSQWAYSQASISRLPIKCRKSGKFSGPDGTIAALFL